ncbi:MAG: hypothetical protein QXP41_04075 [Candidatus Nitrosocaldus sp.]
MENIAVFTVLQKPQVVHCYLIQRLLRKELVSINGQDNHLLHHIAMHEISHAFGLSHTYGDRYGNPATDFYTVMYKYADDFMQIKNWAPHEDRTMEERRNWYPY